jgi:2-polyprenyl-3-methyl-5-hydroxy-6-metoxy-1,4-benzoquinol methylase
MAHLPDLDPNDPVGLETLEALSEADKLNEWMFKTIRPFCEGPILEIGSGIGNISQFFLKDGFDITLTDLRPEYCNLLKNKFENNKNVIAIKQVDLIDPEFEIKFSDQLEKYQTVYALNVVEHIENHSLALDNCYKLLKKGGNLIILVPAYQFLFNSFDEELGHFRRYTSGTLSSLFKSSKFNIIHKQYFNLAATFGWFFYGKVLNKKILPKGPINTYNKLVPIFKLIDKIVFNRIGNSVIIVGKK